MNKTEIYILSGFLGSGKTTLLKQLLEDEKQQSRKVAVMMNELGKVSIDSDSVDEDVPLKDLLDGCICCTISDKLEAQLQELLTVEKPEAIYIETTGAAHPVEVLDSILSPLFADRMVVKGIISVVDSPRWLNRKSLSPQVQQLLIEQVRHADLILLNKADAMTEAEQARLSMEIQALNSHAFSILTSYSKVAIKQVRSMSSGEKNKGSSSHVFSDLKLSTYVYQFQHPVNQSGFEDFLRSLPDTVYRIKGYLKLDSSRYPFLFQFSYGMPLYMQENINMPLNMVFIGENLDWDKIEHQLHTLEEKTE
ncbi:GTP-binding protein [Bacillus sp. ISL-47]|uniref:CobW family GTP-binding protein n=1 Tax=Bacillus sp. ISL-47 TaxID=2819130 RepID=UPI001BE90F0F|nr:GTP-binding protein [Bacillus sp. ISL-47]MBT2690220.1 GTP-binding protein [Bacillus sp. ISL-47]MBT2709015.1 GTP-binding protein [Pseudomonas sp. ISL-84]